MRVSLHVAAKSLRCLAIVAIIWSMEAKKVSRGFRFFMADLERIDRLRRDRETKTDFIEIALQHEFELREGKSQRMAMSSLA